jgi:hypothetical protein
MANASHVLFNFYRRYRWRAADFTALQGSLVEQIRALAEGLASKSVVDGYSYTGATGLTVGVEAGIALGPTGNLLIQTAAATATFASPVANPAWSLLVVRPKLTNSESMTRPTNPFDTVYLKQVNASELVVINGTPAASPAYPSIQSNDVVLFGVKLEAGASAVTTAKLDLLVRDRLGKNSDLGGLQKDDFLVSSTHALATHKSIVQALADPSLTRGKRIRVAQSETINSALTVSVPEVEIAFDPDVTFTKGTSATGFIVAASGVTIQKPRMKDFSGGSDVAIGYTAAADYGAVVRARYKNCTNELVDLTTSGVDHSSFTEV